MAKATPQTAPGDDLLMAYADGVLDDATARDVEAAMAADPDIAAQVAMFARTAELLRADAARPAPPVPDALRARIEATLAAARQTPGAAAAPAPTSAGATILPFLRRAAPAAAARPAAARPAAARLALAASIALAVGLGAGFWAGQTGKPQGVTGGLRIAALDSPDLPATLASLPSGQVATLPNGDRIAAIASFRNGAGEFCREFEQDGVDGRTLVSVACHGGADWDIRLAIAAPRADAQSYAPASSLETLDAFMAATEAGAPMPPDEEQDALDALR
ncbi:hypothetical protein [Phaeovulum sp. NW3]|uniref:anti-sigma factor family protein n=1 Tax=Phaeovulum sp. NW3 TaxID=2934933 RepID=UPI002020D7ED|nr:hypothetical protein [Phaeovulum sp. NW3]MCL7465109.1 hypothetical protein [Phaeovulum sp. NW3]